MKGNKYYIINKKDKTFIVLANGLEDVYNYLESSPFSASFQRTVNLIHIEHSYYVTGYNYFEASLMIDGNIYTVFIQAQTMLNAVTRLSDLYGKENKILSVQMTDVCYFVSNRGEYNYIIGN